MRAWLKEAHGLGQNTQWAIAFEVARRNGWVEPDVEGYVASQFAAVAAATRTRVDLGLRFVDAPASPLLAPSNGPGQSTHRIGLTSTDDVTAEVEALARAAYDQNG